VRARSLSHLERLHSASRPQFVCLLHLISSLEREKLAFPRAGCGEAAPLPADKTIKRVSHAREEKRREGKAISNFLTDDELRRRSLLSSPRLGGSFQREAAKKCLRRFKFQNPFRPSSFDDQLAFHFFPLRSGGKPLKFCLLPLHIPSLAVRCNVGPAPCRRTCRRERGTSPDDWTTSLFIARVFSDSSR